MTTRPSERTPTRYQQAVLVQLIDVYPGLLTTWEITQRCTGEIPNAGVYPVLRQCENHGWIHSYRSGPGESVGWSFVDPDYGDTRPDRRKNP